MAEIDARLAAIAERFAAQAEIQQAITAWPSEQKPRLMWTDDFSNLLQILK